MNNLIFLINELIREDNKLSNIEIPTSLEGKKELYRALRNIRNPKPINEEYLKLQDEYLQNEIKEKGITDEKNISFNKNIISIWQGDITTLKCDVIVNACNEYLLGCFIPGHNCIDNAIHSFAGIELREECNDIMKGKTLPNGEVVLTSAYNLPSKYIIQTVGPKVSGIPTKQDIEDLRNCYFNSLELCKEKGLKTIAFPCISTGLYGFPKEDASEIAINTIKDYLKNNKNVFKHIIFNVFTDEDLEIYTNNLK
ncbi:MAG: protein-ADP-ribose hydrolase [Bacilli bacterium]|nr:protein-ADP-ribose hydrolase [Bacilli bacterium]